MDSQLTIFSESWRKCPGEKHCQSILLAFIPLGFCVCVCVCVCVRALASVFSVSCPTLCDPMDCSLPGSSVQGISQARILGWVVISFSRGLPDFSFSRGLPDFSLDLSDSTAILNFI